MPVTQSQPKADGIHTMVPRERWSPAARQLRDTFAITPGQRLMRTEFGFYSLDAWKQQGMPQDVSTDKLFGFEPWGNYDTGGLGWCEAAFVPAFEEKVLEDRGEYELVQDVAGRGVLCFKGRRSGFMPEYVTHPVKDMKTWQDNVKWRLDPKAPGRFADHAQNMARAVAAAGRGEMICQHLIGGYMYLRSLIGPEELLYMFHDSPELIHDCMKAWFDLADVVIARHQQHVTIEEIFFAEDICYNHGPLIGPDMMREFILPYYQQLISNLKGRNIDCSRKLFIQIDTDGDCRPVIPVYMSGIGMNSMSPFEVASGCDVVELGRQYPDLIMRGGIDKRVLAQGRPAIDRMLEYIFPAMRARGGYIPCCDHGVPAEVPYQDYVYFRKRADELSG
jgi:uroporphyrinogen decarboxylase